MIYTDAEDDDYRRSSLVDLNDIDVQVGPMVREAARVAFGRYFKDGAASASTMRDAQQFRVVVHPKIISCSNFRSGADLSGVPFVGGDYRTPRAKVELRIDLLGHDGVSISQRAYENSSGPTPGFDRVDAKGYSSATHNAILALMNRAARDLRQERAPGYTQGLCWVGLHSRQPAF